MAYVVAVLNSKGGSGKTTLTTNLGGSLHRRGFSVLIVDSDPQGTARDWHHAQPEETDLPAVIGMDRPTLHKDLAGIARPYDFVLIDGAARLENMVASALKAADFVLIPVQPSGYDLWAVTDLVDLLKTRQEVTDGKPQVAFVISRQILGTHLASEASDAVAALGFPVFEARTTQRVAYAEAGQSGLTVFEFDAKSKAATEIDAITTELLTSLNYEQAKATVA